jgi:hypothetical protein
MISSTSGGNSNEGVSLVSGNINRALSSWAAGSPVFLKQVGVSVAEVRRAGLAAATSSSSSSANTTASAIGVPSFVLLADGAAALVPGLQADSAVEVPAADLRVLTKHAIDLRAVISAAAAAAAAEAESAVLALAAATAAAKSKEPGASAPAAAATATAAASAPKARKACPPLDVTALLCEVARFVGDDDIEVTARLLKQQQQQQQKKMQQHRKGQHLHSNEGGNDEEEDSESESESASAAAAAAAAAVAASLSPETLAGLAAAFEQARAQCCQEAGAAAATGGGETAGGAARQVVAAHIVVRCGKDAGRKQSGGAAAGAPIDQSQDKRRLSKAERKKLKAGNGAAVRAGSAGKCNVDDEGEEEEGGAVASAAEQQVVPAVLALQVVGRVIANRKASEPLDHPALSYTVYLMSADDVCRSYYDAC